MGPLVAERACMTGQVFLAVNGNIALLTLSHPGKLNAMSRAMWGALREAALVMRAAGELTAREMLLAVAVLDAPTLLQRGFLNRVSSDDQVAADVLVAAGRVAQLAPRAARLNKQCFSVLDHDGRASPATHLIAKAYACADSAEHREGVTAFTEKRSPRFSAR